MVGNNTLLFAAESCKRSRTGRMLKKVNRFESEPFKGAIKNDSPICNFNEIAHPNRSTLVNEPLQLKDRYLFDISSHILKMELHITQVWSIFAPQSQDLFEMLDAAQMLSGFLADKLFGKKEGEAKNFKHLLQRSKIVVYIIKRLLCRFKDIHDTIACETAMIEEVNRNLYLIKSFDTKVSLNCPTIKKKKLSFNDFSVANQSNSGSFSLVQSKKLKGILIKKTSEPALEDLNCQNDFDNKTAENTFADDTSEPISLPKERIYAQKSKNRRGRKKKSEGATSFMNESLRANDSLVNEENYVVENQNFKSTVLHEESSFVENAKFEAPLNEDYCCLPVVDKTTENVVANDIQDNISSLKENSDPSKPKPKRGRRKIEAKVNEVNLMSTNEGILKKEFNTEHKIATGLIYQKNSVNETTENVCTISFPKESSDIQKPKKKRGRKKKAEVSPLPTPLSFVETENKVLETVSMPSMSCNLSKQIKSDRNENTEASKSKSKHTITIKKNSIGYSISEIFEPQNMMDVNKTMLENRKSETVGMDFMPTVPKVEQDFTISSNLHREKLFYDEKTESLKNSKILHLKNNYAIVTSQEQKLKCCELQTVSTTESKDSNNNISEYNSLHVNIRKSDLQNSSSLKNVMDVPKVEAVEGKIIKKEIKSEITKSDSKADSHAISCTRKQGTLPKTSLLKIPKVSTSNSIISRKTAPVGKSILKSSKYTEADPRNLKRYKKSKVNIPDVNTKKEAYSEIKETINNDEMMDQNVGLEIEIEGSPIVQQDSQSGFRNNKCSNLEICGNLDQQIKIDVGMSTSKEETKYNINSDVDSRVVEKFPTEMERKTKNDCDNNAYSSSNVSGSNVIEENYLLMKTIEGIASLLDRPIYDHRMLKDAIAELIHNDKSSKQVLQSTDGRTLQDHSYMEPVPNEEQQQQPFEENLLNDSYRNLTYDEVFEIHKNKDDGEKKMFKKQKLLKTESKPKEHLQSEPNHNIVCNTLPKNQRIQENNTISYGIGRKFKSVYISTAGNFHDNNNNEIKTNALNISIECDKQKNNESVVIDKLHTSKNDTCLPNCNIIKENFVKKETMRSEELMNTEKFIQNSIGINLFQNTMDSESLSQNCRDNVSLSKIPKPQRFKTTGDLPFTINENFVSNETKHSEEFMNTQQFLESSVDINFSQNTVDSMNISKASLNDVSLSKFTKRPKYDTIGNCSSNVTKHLERVQTAQFEELMNTQQFMENSIDINFSQNSMDSEYLPKKCLGNVSLPKVIKGPRLEASTFPSTVKENLGRESINGGQFIQNIKCEKFSKASLDDVSLLKITKRRRLKAAGAFPSMVVYSDLNW